MVSIDPTSRRLSNSVDASINESISESQRDSSSCQDSQHSIESDTRDTTHPKHTYQPPSPSKSCQKCGHNDDHEAPQSVSPIQAAASAVVRRINTLRLLKQRRTVDNTIEAKVDQHPPRKHGPSRTTMPQPSKPISSRKPQSRPTGKENLPVDPATKPHRRPLANITNTDWVDSRPHHLPPAPETAPKAQPVHKYNPGAGASAGLRIELNGVPLVAIDERYLDQDRFADFSPPFISTPLDPKNLNLKRGDTNIFGKPISSASPNPDLSGLRSVNTTPLREAIAAFSDIFSSGGSQRSGKADLEAGSTPISQTRSGTTLSTPSSLKMPRISGSISRLKRRLTLSTSSPDQ